MATNKHATIRYHALDRCFANYGRKFFIEDLIKACNDAIFDFSGIVDGVKRRQVFDDITFMESDQGWSIPLVRNKEGRRIYYRYDDKNFSIKNKGINQTEAEQLNDTLTILSRFKGLPQFEWIEEMQIRLDETFKLSGKIKTNVGFEQNPYLKGLNHFTAIFNAIQNEVVLKINYQGFKQKKNEELKFHPWYLKQFNNRWFVFGFNEEYNNISNLALDRIFLIKELKRKFIVNNNIDFEEYFEDVIGVTINQKIPVEKIKLKIKSDAWPYIESKPIHGSQKIISRNQQFVTVEINVQPNHELFALLFSYLDAIEVLEPLTIRNKVKTIVKSQFDKYF